MKPIRSWSAERNAALSGVVAFLAVALTVAHPGITIDEPLDVRPGRTYIETLVRRGAGFFDPATIDRVYRDNAEHPPLGRWLLGIASKVGEPFETLLLGPDPVGLYILSARLAPAACFGWLIFLVSREAGRRYGRLAGFLAGWSLFVMPRCFGHAHLAALDTFVTTFWTWAFLALVRTFESPRPVKSAALSGLIFGLALLVKIHGWLLIPCMLGLAAVRTLRALRQRQPHAPPSHRPLTIAAAAIVWLLIGLILYFVAWPWLWSDPIGRLLGYLRTGVDRTPIRVLYFGQIHLDRDVPWHYPWLYTLTTVPTAVGLVGLWGAVRILVRRPRDPFALASLGAILLWLGLFSTRVPVYDGERLFLPVFALASILIGHTCAHILTRFTARPKLRLLAWAVLALQVAPLLHMHPYEFSYYNELVGGLPGAERLGLELTTWTDVVDPGLLDELAQNAAPDEVSALVPTLAPQQGLLMTTRLQARRRVLLADQEARANATWVILHRREAYWPPDIELLTRTPAVQLRSRSGVWLSGLWRTRPSASNRPSP